MIDQETLVLTAIILGVGYMLLNNTQGPAIDPARQTALEGEIEVRSLQTRAQQMLETVSQWQSQVSDLH